MVEQSGFQPGQRIVHRDFGEGVIVELPRDGYARAFFGVGERQVSILSIQPLLSRNQQILNNVASSPERLQAAWLAYEAHAIPLMDNATALTAAKIDLLPHQVVLTHRVATASPRRFLIADEVGLGKTVETALILRELASRGELKRALMVVPAGLVNNWHRELNEVFHLDFEVFGSEGDVTDRKSNAFAKHDRLIASIDTLKLPNRVKKLTDAPPWDLIVFDEAHHVAAYRNGGSVRKTQNFKLAEVLKNHSRDLLLLSATPHQGDHFRFWMLVQLLNPTLFNSTEDMVNNRHRLNAVIFRRTKADGCLPDGSPLFARRWVHTESFVMSDLERKFYGELRSYLEDGFSLAKRQGNKGRGLGFVMSIFQKIAASSFASVKRTLRRRCIMLTLQEAILRDRELDIDGREALYSEARLLIREEYSLTDDQIGRADVDRILADMKAKLIRQIDEEMLSLAADSYGGEFAAAQAEDVAASIVSLALPEERLRIKALLEYFPKQHETKIEKLIRALGALWRQNPDEKVVIFATYIGTVDLIEQEIETAYPGQGVVVLKGGDHGAKLAAERKFKRQDGPKVLVCTAAGREGINLQFARILFNFDLPWNPMDIEQRIGRIHRYGQRHTAQVYNLVLSDTIEGHIFLLLEDKLLEIARTVGKVDEHGNVAEDLRSQILGQLSERVSYESLYREALSDPELRRTRLELEAALANASEARKVVFDLFQDLEGFNLEEYKPFADVSIGMNRLTNFLQVVLNRQNQSLVQVEKNLFEIRNTDGNVQLICTTDREVARQKEKIDLIGLDHPLLQQALQQWRGLSPENLGIAVKNEGYAPAVLTWWQIETHGGAGETHTYLKPLAIKDDGQRLPTLEREGEKVFQWLPAEAFLSFSQREKLLKESLEPMLQRELHLHGLVTEQGGFNASLVSWIEVSGHNPLDKKLLDEKEELINPKEQTLELASEDSEGIQKFITHLPLHNLSAVAASEPQGEWGPAAHEQLIETLGWIKVENIGRQLNDLMFVARIVGHSMDDGHSGIKDGNYAVFELWPRGSRQNKIVLVQGSFSDPETGSYVVKKYVADSRGEDRRHQSISLVSLNPNKELYPDIKLRPEDEDYIRVVASFVTILDKPNQNPGPDEESPLNKQTKARYRDITSEKGRERVERDLNNALQRFFSPTMTDEESTNLEKAQETVWQARYICLDIDAGGLCIEAGPLSGLPNFVKQLVVERGSWNQRLLASNVRSRSYKVPIEPSYDNYYWKAPDHEELLADELNSLTLLGFAKDKATVFHIDAAGIGQLITTSFVTSGQAYRILIPPSLASVVVDLGNIDLLREDWRLWEIEIPSATTTEFVQTLAKLGLSLSKSAPIVHWAFPPLMYRSSPKGESYPCFTIDQTPVLTIRGIKVEQEGELNLLVLGPNGTTTWKMPIGESWLVAFEDLTPGQYIAEVLPLETQFERIWMPFVIEESLSPMSIAEANVYLGSAKYNIDGVTSWAGDLTLLGTDDFRFEIETPPLWPVDFTWVSQNILRLGRIQASANGIVDTSSIIFQTENVRHQAKLGELKIDFGELGLFKLQHNRDISAEQFYNRLSNLIAKKYEVACSLLGQFSMLRAVWVEPIVQLLGYSVKELPEESVRDIPLGIAGFLLQEARKEKEKIITVTTKLLFLTDPIYDLNKTMSDDLYRFVDLLCNKIDVSHAFITNGLVWMLYRSRVHISSKRFDIKEIVSEDKQELLATFRLLFQGEG